MKECFENISILEIKLISVIRKENICILIKLDQIQKSLPKDIIDSSYQTLNTPIFIIE